MSLMLLLLRWSAAGPSLRTDREVSSRVLLALLWLLWLAGCSPPPTPDSETASAFLPAPDFSLERLDGSGPVSLVDLRGKTVVLDFWATWCAPCERQVPAINAFYAEHGSDADLAVFGVSADLDGPDVVQQWVSDKGVEYPILLGGEELAREFGATGFPVTYILDGQGQVRRRHLGVIEATELNEVLAYLRGSSD